MRMREALAELDQRVLGSPTQPRCQPTERPARSWSVPAPVWTAGALAVASWIMQALWPPMSWHPLAGAAIAAALAYGICSRRRVFLWLLLVWIAAKAAMEG